MERRDWEETVREKRHEQEQQLRSFDETLWLAAADKTREELLSAEELRLTALTAGELASEIAAGRATAYLVTRAFCKSALIAHRKALDQAAALDETQRASGVKGRLHGVPVSLKDQFNVVGVDTTLGYVGSVGNIADRDSSAVEILRAEGAVFYCKTNLPQTILSGETRNNLFGLTTHPRHPDLSPAGSSGGEGALIASFGSPMGWGTDIGGSIRGPAAVNGLFGLKPSSTRLPYQDVTNSQEGQEMTMSVIGPMARTIDDIELGMRVMVDAKPWTLDSKCCPVPWRSVTLPASLNIGVIYDDGLTRPTSVVMQAFHQLCLALSAAGHNVSVWEPPVSHEDCCKAIDVMTACDDGMDIRAQLDKSGEPPCEHTAALLGRAHPMSTFEWWQLNKHRLAIQKRYLDGWNASGRLFANGRPADILLEPTYTMPAYLHLTTPGQRIALRKTWNLLDYSVLSFPLVPDRHAAQVALPAAATQRPFTEMERHEEELMQRVEALGANLPVGIQIIGRRLDEETVIAAYRTIAAAIA